MSSPLAIRLNELLLQEGEIAICFLGQAGLLIKAYPEQYFVIDPYLSDYCFDTYGLAFKRLTPSLLNAADLDELPLQAYIMTHHHEDHLDVPTVAALNNRSIPFYTDQTTISKLQELGIENERCFPLSKHHQDVSYVVGPATIRAVFADHGDLAPDAVGILFECHGKRIYHMGDTCLNREEFQAIRRKYAIDFLLVPINGRYGNMNEVEAAEATAILSPKIAVPCHFWMLPANSGGDPAAFAQNVSEITEQRLMATGEVMVI
jgi:L-ascorbate 6-phosphate lactonase